MPENTAQEKLVANPWTLQQKAQTSSEWSGPFAVMSTDWPRAFPELCFSGIKLPPPRNHTRAGYVEGRGIGSRSAKIYSVTVSRRQWFLSNG